MTRDIELYSHLSNHMAKSCIAVHLHKTHTIYFKSAWTKNGSHFFPFIMTYLLTLYVAPPLFSAVFVVFCFPVVFPQWSHKLMNEPLVLKSYWSTDIC